MSYIIVSDSTTDLGYEFMEKEQVPFLPFSYTIGDDEYFDDMGKSVDGHDFYQKMREGAAIPVTAQINVERYRFFFETYLKEGQDLIYLCFSSGLSGSYMSAVQAQKELATQFPERRIEVIDSLAASMGEGLLLWDAIEKRNSGMDFADLVQHIRRRIAQTNHWFTVDDLNHLYRGGRVSKTSAVIGSVLSIKPILRVDDAGHLIAVGKMRGKRKALTALAEKVAENIIESETQTILISHGDAREDAQFLAEEIEKKVRVNGFYFSMIGPVIGAHSGPGTVAVFFFGK